MKKPAKQQINLWISIFVVNIVVIYLAAQFFPELVVLGNISMPGWIAAILTSLILTAILTQVSTLVKVLKLKIDNDLSWVVVYGIIDMIVIWCIAHLALWTGFGIASILIVVVLGVVLDIFQYGVWKLLKGKKNKL